MSFIAAAVSAATVSRPASSGADVAVYGSSAAAPIAAIAASRSGAYGVTLLTQTSHVGGMLTGGLMHTDSANGLTVQGIAREFFVRTEEQYPGRPTNSSYPPGHSPPGWLFESHIGERVLLAMLYEANVTTIYSVGGVVMTRRDGLAIDSIVFESGVSLAAKVWIDASYEGGIAERVATMTWGRESKTKYGETAAGRLKTVPVGASVSPYWDAGATPYDIPSNVIPHVSAAHRVAIGASDRWVEPFDFRLCFTTSPSHQMLFTRPASYNASEFEFWRRIYEKTPPSSLSEAGLSCLGPIPNTYSDCPKSSAGREKVGPCKCDMLGMDHGTDDTGGSWTYINGSNDERKRVWQRHIDFTQGLLWFWASDLSVPLEVRNEMATLGHCTDEYDDKAREEFGVTIPPHWPHQLYVREGKRLVGDWVWTQHQPIASKLNRTIGIGSYNFDSHYVSRTIQRTGDAREDIIVKEGRVKVQSQMPAGDRPSVSGLAYGCVAFNASHINRVSRCVAGLPADLVMGNGTDASCGGACAALAHNEWLAVKRLSAYTNANKTLVVRLPTGQASSWLKKSKKLANTLPPSLKLTVTEGERISLSSEPNGVDATYDFVQLVSRSPTTLAATTTSCGVCMDAPFAMPFDTMVPKPSEVSNLLVPVAISATHVRYNAIRMAPAWMILGHAAGAAAAQVVEKKLTSVGDVSVAELQRVLVKQKQLLVWQSPLV